jgi:hypothetical protein
MNDVLYKYLIVPWFDYHNRPIVKKEDMWIMAHRRVKYDDQYCELMTDIILHAASPCCPRYCICKYFSKNDKMKFYRRENLL